MKHIALFLFLSLLIACAPTTVLEGQAPVEVARPALVPDDAVLMVVRPEGNAGISQIYNLNDNALLYDLPAGRTDVDNTMHFAANTENTDTQITRTQINTGKPTKQYKIEGKWQLVGLSPNGLWLALAQPASNLTTIKVLNATTGEEVHTLALNGQFEVEAISTNGQFLYLIHHLSDENYQVRLYDLNIQELAAQPLSDKRIQDAFMTGYAWGTTMSKQGDWLLTLYLDQKRQTAFIHALNLDNGFTLCLNLPSDGGDFDTLQQYSITLASDGQTIYAANAALGKLAEISLLDFDQAKVVDFTPAAFPATKQVMQTSLLSTDGDTLYFALDNQLWAYDTATKTVSTPMVMEGIIAGISQTPSPTTPQLHLAYTTNKLETISTTAFNFPIPVVRK